MRKNKLKKLLLTAFLSVAMVLEPVGAAATVYAASYDTPVIEVTATEEASEDVISLSSEGIETSEDETTVAEPEDSSVESDDSEVSEQEETVEEETEVGEESEIEEENSVSDEANEEDVEEDVTSADNSEEEAVIEEASEDETLAQFDEMPETYSLNAEQSALKEDMRVNMLDEFLTTDEGDDYVPGQIIVSVKDENDAYEVAKAFHGTVIGYFEGFALVELEDNILVADAVQASAKEEVNLPPAFPNYYAYLDSTYDENDISELISEEIADIEENIEEDDSFISYGEDELIIIDESEEVSEEDEDISEDALGAFDDSINADPYLSQNSDNYQYHHDIIGSRNAWNYGAKGSGIKVAVIDSGLTNNATLRGELNLGEALCFCSATTSNAKADGHANNKDNAGGTGHGSHVAGIIGAKDDGKLGTGVAPSATVSSFRVADSNGSINTYGCMAAINYAAANGYHVANISIGGPFYSSAYQTVIDNAYAKGLAIICSSGNDGGTVLNYPGTYNHTLCVGATDRLNKKTVFSTCGYFVDIAMPGQDIWSFDGSGTANYISMSGTSMSTPVATGMAAAILSKQSSIPSLSGKTGAARVDALFALMKGNTIKVSGGLGKGIPNFAKIFKLNTITQKPTAPVITATSDTANKLVNVKLNSQYGTTIYYSTDGKAVTYSRGTASANANSTGYSSSINIKYEDIGKQAVTISAIAVNVSSGLVSPAKKITLKLAAKTTGINISGITRLAKGKSAKYTAEVLPAYAANKTVKWSISPINQGVTISSTGTVTAKSSATTGTYYITAKTADATKSYTISVTDALLVKAVSFQKQAISLTANGTNYQYSLFPKLVYTPVITGQNLSATNFIWTSSNPKVATVSTGGVVTAKAPGTVTITAIANDGSGKKATQKITVVNKVTSITLVAAPGSRVAAGKKVTITPTFNGGNPVNNKKLEWSVSPEGKGVTVSNGVVSTKADAAVGNYTVYAKSLDPLTLNSSGAPTISKSITITVYKGGVQKIKPRTASVGIFRINSSFTGATRFNNTTLYADVTTVEGSSNSLSDFTYTNDSTGLVSVSNFAYNTTSKTLSLKVTASGKGTGKAKITMMSKDGTGAKCTFTVTVTNPASSVLISTNKKTSTVFIGKSLKLSGQVGTDNGAVATKKLTWSTNLPSEYSSLIKVSSSGSVSVSSKLKAEGNFTVYARATDGSNAVGKITVTAKYPVTGVSWGGNSSGAYYVWYSNCSASSERYMSMPVYVTTKSNLGYSIQIASSDPKTATLWQRNGTVYLTAYKRGKVTVTITVEGKSCKYNIEIL